MPYGQEKDTRTPGIRSYTEAWDLALDHKGIMYQLLYAYVRKHSLPWYQGEDLQKELESYAWEGFFDACRKWDPTKGYTLSTYAYPAVRNALNARMKVLERMGTSMIGHNQTKGEVHKRPYLESIQREDERKASRNEGELSDSANIADLTPQPWMDFEPLMEDAVVDAIDQAEKVQRIARIVEGMSEPHKTIFESMFFSDPTHERAKRSIGAGLTLKEAASEFGRSTTWAREILDEAIEYIRHHLEAENEI